MILLLLISLGCTPESDCPEWFEAEVGANPFAELDETSGIAAGNGVLWLHNDTADSPALFAISEQGEAIARYQVLNAAVNDWEDITRAHIDDNASLLIGDIGDNEESRPEIIIYTINEPAVAQQGTIIDSVVSATSQSYTYPDKPTNSEALAWDPISGELYLLTKENGASTLFQFPESEGPLAELTTISVGNGALAGDDKVTGATFSDDGSRFAISTRDEIWVWVRVRGDEALGDLLHTAPCRVPVSEIGEIEAVAFDSTGRLVVTAEGVGAKILAYSL